MNEFTLEEAVSLLYRHVVPRSLLIPDDKKPSLTDIGYICGLLTLNEQTELVVKFYSDIQQFTKEEFQAKLVVLEK